MEKVTTTKPKWCKATEMGGRENLWHKGSWKFMAPTVTLKSLVEWMLFDNENRPSTVVVYIITIALMMATILDILLVIFVVYKVKHK